jgi:polysaccharide biosynthesis transport protein
MSPQQILLILRKRLWMIGLAFMATMAGAVGIMLVVPPRYDATATASVDAGQLDPVTGQAGGAVGLLRVLQGNLVALAQSQRVGAEVAKRLNLARDPSIAEAFQSSSSRERMSIEEWIASEYLVKNLEAKFTEGSNILTIKYKTNSPTQAALIANTFLSAFLDAAVELKASAAQQTAQWLDPQMEKMRTDLKLASEKLERFQRDANSLAPTAANDTETNQLIALTTELTSAKNQLLLLQSQTNPKNQNAGAEKNLSLLPDSSTLVAIKNNLANVIAEIGKVQAEVGENNPRLINLRATRRSLEDQIRIEVGSRDKALREQIQFLEQAREAQMQKLISQQAQRDQLSSLQREVQMRQEQIDNSAKAAETARLQSRLSFLNITTLDKATAPSSPAFPKRSIVMLLGAGAGGALGVIFALLAEALDRRVRVLSDLEFAASAPVLGTLLGTKQLRRMLSRRRPAALSHEAQEIKQILERSARRVERPPTTYSLADRSDRARDRRARGYRS